jgi:hypothetical protein
MSSGESELLLSFEARDLDPATFRHSEHLGVAYEMLRKYGFMEAATRYAENIHAIAVKAGAAGKFNATITFAFMSLIAERMALTEHSGCGDFIARNPDLMSKDLLKSWYSPERLQSDLARQIFLMPDIACKSGLRK